MEGGRMSYHDIFDVIVLFYSQRIELPKVIDMIFDYYMQRGYDEDELSLLGNSKACKMLKAISVLNPNSTSKYAPMFFDSCFNYVKKNHKNFTSMQLKRAIEFFDNTQYFKDLENQKVDGKDHLIVAGIKEFKDFYHKKLVDQQNKKLGVKLEMSTEETTLNPEDQKQEDNIFERDLSEDEEELKSQIEKDPKLREEYIYKKNKSNNLITKAIKQVDFSQFSSETTQKAKVNQEYKDSRINKLVNMIDESYNKYEKFTKKQK